MSTLKYWSRIDFSQVRNIHPLWTLRKETRKKEVWSRKLHCFEPDSALPTNLFFPSYYWIVHIWKKFYTRIGMWRLHPLPPYQFVHSFSAWKGMYDWWMMDDDDALRISSPSSAFTRIGLQQISLLLAHSYWSKVALTTITLAAWIFLCQTGESICSSPPPTFLAFGLS